MRTKGVFQGARNDLSILLWSLRLRPDLQSRRSRWADSGGGRERPPFRGPGSGAADRSRPNPSPCGKAARPMWKPGADDSSGRRRNGWFPHRQGRQFRKDLGLHVSIRRVDYRPSRAAHKTRYPESADRRAPRTRRMPIPTIVNTDSGAWRPSISGGGQRGRSEATTAISTFDYVCGSFLTVRHTVHRKVGSLPSMSNSRQSSSEVS